MEQYYTVKDMLAKLQGAGIKIDRANLFIKIRKGIVKPQAYTMIGKRRYPKYNISYINKLIACATVFTKLDWKKVQELPENQLEPQKI